MHVASQLPGRGFTHVDVAPVPAHYACNQKSDDYDDDEWWLHMYFGDQWWPRKYVGGQWCCVYM